jgi:hypothetical protein
MDVAPYYAEAFRRLPPQPPDAVDQAHLVGPGNATGVEVVLVGVTLLRAAFGRAASEPRPSEEAGGTPYVAKRGGARLRRDDPAQRNDRLLPLRSQHCQECLLPAVLEPEVGFEPTTFRLRVEAHLSTR